MPGPMQLVNGIFIPFGDTHFAAALRASPIMDGKGTYQLSKIQAVLPFARDRRVALDIGAHVGLWTMQLAKSFETVHAFEPLPVHVECFKANTAELKNVILHELCLGSHNGVAAIQPIEDNSGNSHMAATGETIASALMANLNRLDDYAEERMPGVEVGFIKIDVEGYEIHVVKGAEKLIQRCRPVMVVEQKPGYAERYGCSTGLVLNLLKSWGARIVWQRAGDFCLTWE